jgi:pimeloyl-ACP methyl ester carboxylesterase
MNAVTLRPARAPSALLMLAEFRALWEAGATLAVWPVLKLAPRGDGHPVLVLPGLTSGDSSTLLLRRYLKGRGYDVHGWGQGRNFGPRAGVEESMVMKLEELHAKEGRKVSLVGKSLGGAYARFLAHRHPKLVRSVVTLGSPFKGSPRSTRAWRVYEGLSGRSAEDEPRLKLVARTPRVPTTSIFSRSDGIVAWRCSVESTGRRSENIEVLGSHLGLDTHPAVLYALADRLAQPEGKWRPFQRGMLGPLLFPNPARGKSAA